MHTALKYLLPAPHPKPRPPPPTQTHKLAGKCSLPVGICGHGAIYHRHIHASLLPHIATLQVYNQHQTTAQASASARGITDACTPQQLPCLSSWTSRVAGSVECSMQPDSCRTRTRPSASTHMPACIFTRHADCPAELYMAGASPVSRQVGPPLHNSDAYPLSAQSLAPLRPSTAQHRTARTHVQHTGDAAATILASPCILVERCAVDFADSSAD